MAFQAPAPAARGRWRRVDVIRSAIVQRLLVSGFTAPEAVAALRMSIDPPIRAGVEMSFRGKVMWATRTPSVSAGIASRVPEVESAVVVYLSSVADDATIRFRSAAVGRAPAAVGDAQSLAALRVAPPSPHDRPAVYERTA
jgi:hypothetical protein